MDRTLNFEFDKREENKEITEFIKDLEKALDNNEIEYGKKAYTTIYDEILKEIDIANKYKGKLNSIIKECMKNESYEGAFWYINYDKSQNTFSMDLYNEGKCQKFPITMQDIKNYNYKVGMTYWALENGGMLKEDAIKDSIKIDVDSALADLERENK